MDGVVGVLRIRKAL
jgi:hypothetical protein